MFKQNPNVDPIPAPREDPASVLTVLIAVKEGVENLAGQRGGQLDRAVTFNDLVELGLITAADVRALMR